jgi:hypothetical protein
MMATCAITICLWVLGNAAWSDEPADAGRPPSETTLKRAKQLRAGLADFRLDLIYFGPQDKLAFNSANLVEQRLDQRAVTRVQRFQTGRREAGLSSRLHDIA